MGRKDRVTAKAELWLDSVTGAGTRTGSMGRISGRRDTKGGIASAGAASVSNRARSAGKVGRMMLIWQKIVEISETV
jgi:hypothetical protein